MLLIEEKHLAKIKNYQRILFLFSGGGGEEVIILQRNPLVARQNPLQQKQDSEGTGPELLLNSLVKRISGRSQQRRRHHRNPTHRKPVVNPRLAPLGEGRPSAPHTWLARHLPAAAATRSRRGPNGDANFPGRARRTAVSSRTGPEAKQARGTQAPAGSRRKLGGPGRRRGSRRCPRPP